VDPVHVYAVGALRSMTLEQKIATLLVLHAPGTDGAALGAFASGNGLGGLLLMGDNMPADPQSLAAETSQLRGDPQLPVLVAIDEEGGDVTRLPWDALPGADTLKSMPVQATADAFAGRAALLKAAGVNVNFGIVADTTADPGSFIYDRVLGTDPQSASERVSAAVRAESPVLYGTLKHFPGHGETEADSHSTVPATAISQADWAARDRPPFQAGVRAGARFVMLGHLIYSAVDAAPASLSARWHEILRKDLGFDGIAITDDLNMLQDSGLPEYQNPGELAVRALAAGNTMLLFVTGSDPAARGEDPATLVAAVATAVRSGRLSESMIDDDALRVLEARRALAVTG
jgi:beta-N-acetylhexosaminidase